jgi:hypothetical protein
MQPGDVGIGALIAAVGNGLVAADPARAEFHQFLVGERIGGVGIAPAHVPGIFDEHGAHALALDRAAERRLVEIAEVLLHEQRDIEVGRQLDGAVVGGLDPAVPSERVDDQILGAVRVHGAEPQRQHELRGLVAHLQRPQIAVAEELHAVEIHLGDEEPHALLDVAAEHSLGAGRNPYVDGPRLARGGAAAADRIACDHMSGLTVVRRT